MLNIVDETHVQAQEIGAHLAWAHALIPLARLVSSDRAAVGGQSGKVNHYESEVQAVRTSSSHSNSRIVVFAFHNGEVDSVGYFLATHEPLTRRGRKG